MHGMRQLITYHLYKNYQYYLSALLRTLGKLYRTSPWENYVKKLSKCLPARLLKSKKGPDSQTDPVFNHSHILIHSTCRKQRRFSGKSRSTITSQLITQTSTFSHWKSRGTILRCKIRNWRSTRGFFPLKILFGQYCEHFRKTILMPKRERSNQYFIHLFFLRVRGSVPVPLSLPSPLPRYPCLLPTGAVTRCPAGLSQPRSGSVLWSKSKHPPERRTEQTALSKQSTRTCQGVYLLQEKVGHPARPHKDVQTGSENSAALSRAPRRPPSAEAERGAWLRPARPEQPEQRSRRGRSPAGRQPPAPRRGRGPRLPVPPAHRAPLSASRRRGGRSPSAAPGESGRRLTVCSCSSARARSGRSGRSSRSSPGAAISGLGVPSRPRRGTGPRPPPTPLPPRPPRHPPARRNRGGATGALREPCGAGGAQEGPGAGTERARGTRSAHGPRTRRGVQERMGAPFSRDGIVIDISFWSIK